MGSWTGQIARLQPHEVDRFFPFDALWYEQIAEDAYRWDPSHGTVKQDVAFFPLWPMVLRALGLALLSPTAVRWGAAACAWGFGVLSILTFGALAGAVLREREACAAIWCFALWPGASFLLLSYPTGLMNLLCCLAMLAMLRGRHWAAAWAAGLVTASGPLALGTAIAVFLCAARPRLRSGALPALLLLGTVNICGLLAFLAWQFWKFGDAFPFVEAQAAWAAPVPWLARIPQAILQILIVPDFVVSLAYTVHALQAHTLIQLQATLEKALQAAALGLALLMLLMAWRRVPLPMRLQGLFTLALFVWFHSATRPANSTLRLTYCVLTTALGLGIVLAERPLARRWVLGVFGGLLFGASILSASGYHVV